MTFSDRYPYDENSIRRVAPNDPGVYRLIYKGKDGKFYPFYIGQSENLRARLLDHLQVSEANKCIREHVRGSMCSFRFAVVRSAAERNKLEQQQIDEYKPQCNKQGN